ncbi:MAG: hypothetical protein M1428_00210 [Deltaproteobacteria bacterium]|nr:hypothetical protein [Deltaproteobacteria bacterium]
MRRLFFLIFGISAFAFFFGSCAPPANNNSRPVVYTYASGPTAYTSPAGVTAPDALAIDASGNVWVLGQAGGLAEINPQNGKIITTTPLPGCSSGSNYYAGIAIGVSGNIWAVNNACDFAVEANPSTGTIYTPYTTGTAPYGIAIDAYDNVWVGDNGNYSSPPFSSSVTEIPVSGPSQSFSQGNSLSSICSESVAIDSAGYVWLSGCGYVHTFDPSGAPAGSYKFPFGNPGSIAIGSGDNAWVTDYDTVYELSPNGTFTGTYHVGLNNSIFQGIAIDSAGHVWVTDAANAALLEISPSRGLLAVFAVGNNPGGIAIDAYGDVWVANTNDNTVTEWMGIAAGPQYFPYTGPQFPDGQP